MSVRLGHEKVTSMPVQAMHDGEIAIVESWDSRPERVGVIHQRFGDYLLEVGGRSSLSIGDVWGFTALFDPVKGCRVRVLERGETIVIS